MSKRFIKHLYIRPRYLVLFLIRFYQKVFSFDHGWLKSLYPNGFCRYLPSCSEYGYLCIQRFGVFKGGYLACVRLFHCHPFSKGGMDEPPKIV